MTTCTAAAPDKLRNAMMIRSYFDKTTKEWTYTVAKRPPMSSAPNVCGTSTADMVGQEGVITDILAESLEIIY